MKPNERANILAVDDNPAKLMTLSAILAELNENVVTASSGREALRFLLQEEFAVVLLDVHMPSMDGFETAALIRQRKSSEHTPIIFVTSYPDDTHAARGYSLGAVDYILAPVDPEVLKTKVVVFVELFKKAAQVRMQAQALEHRAQQLQRLTRASLAINSALSPDQMLQVVADLARDILGARQAEAVAAPDQKWSAPRTAVSLSPGSEGAGEQPVLRDQAALLSLLSAIRGTIQIPRGSVSSDWDGFLASDRPARLGWLAAPLTGRDGCNMGLLHVLESRGAVRDRGQRHRQGNDTGLLDPGFRPFPPGGQLDDPLTGRTGNRTRHCPPPDRTARRFHLRGERGARPGFPVSGFPAGRRPRPGSSREKAGRTGRGGCLRL